MFETLIDLERPMYARGLSLQGRIYAMSAHMMHTSDPLEPYKKSIAQRQNLPRSPEQLRFLRSKLFSPLEVRSKLFSTLDSKLRSKVRVLGTDRSLVDVKFPWLE